MYIYKNIKIGSRLCQRFWCKVSFIVCVFTKYFCPIRANNFTYFNRDSAGVFFFLYATRYTDNISSTKFVCFCRKIFNTFMSKPIKWNSEKLVNNVLAMQTKENLILSLERAIFPVFSYIFNFFSSKLCSRNERLLSQIAAGKKLITGSCLSCFSCLSCLYC